MSAAEGIRLFNEGQFFEAHEAMEAEWTGERGPRRLFLQALIHLAVAFHHQDADNPTGARLQMEKAVRKLAGYLPRYEALDTQRLHTEGVAALEALARGELAAPMRMNIS